MQTNGRHSETACPWSIMLVHGVVEYLSRISRALFVSRGPTIGKEKYQRGFKCAPKI